MNQLINETVANIITKKVAEALHQELTGSWGVVLTQLANTQESNQHLKQVISEKIADLNKFQRRLEQLVFTIQEQTDQTSENQKKAAKLLKKAIIELGLEE